LWQYVLARQFDERLAFLSAVAEGSSSSELLRRYGSFDLVEIVLEVVHDAMNATSDATEKIARKSRIILSDRARLEQSRQCRGASRGFSLVSATKFPFAASFATRGSVKRGSRNATCRPSVAGA
jgi:hypothetical protein